MSIKWPLILCSLLWFVRTVCLCAQEPVLDLEKMQTPPAFVPPKGSGKGHNSGFGATSPDGPPVKPTILSAERDATESNPRIVMLLRIQNTGDYPIDLPCTLDYRLADEKQKNPVLAIDLTVRTPSGKRYILGPQFLYGSKAVPGSIIVLSPHQSIQIRAPFPMLRVLPEGKSESLPVDLSIGVSFPGGPLSNFAFANSQERFSYQIKEK